MAATATTSENLFAMSIVDTCTDETDQTYIVFYQVNGNELELGHLRKMLGNSDDITSLDAGRTNRYTFGLHTMTLPTSFETKFLLTEETMKTVTNTFLYGTCQVIGFKDPKVVPVTPFWILRGKYTFNNDAMYGFVSERSLTDDMYEYDYKTLENMGGNWQGTKSVAEYVKECHGLQLQTTEFGAQTD